MGFSVFTVSQTKKKMTPWALRHSDRQLRCVPANYVHPKIFTGLGFMVQVKIYMKYRQSILTLAGHNNFLLSVQVVFVALGVAAAALEGWRGLKDVPQGPSADLTT